MERGERTYKERQYIQGVGNFAIETSSGVYRSVDKPGWYMVNVRGGGDVDLVDVILDSKPIKR